MRTKITGIYDNPEDPDALSEQLALMKKIPESVRAAPNTGRRLDVTDAASGAPAPISRTGTRSGKPSKRGGTRSCTARSAQRTLSRPP
jgi:hypothetical protein